MAEDVADHSISWPKPGDMAFVGSPVGEGAQISQDLHGRLILMMTGYKEAADCLVEQARIEPFQRNTLVYPIIFNYRQFIELNLKYLIFTYGAAERILVKWDTHSLNTLWKKFVEVLGAYNVDDPNQADRAVSAIIGEFAKIDPDSFSFRYPVDKKGNLVPVSEDELDLGRLRDIMTTVDNFFSGCDGYLDHLSRCTP